MIKPVLAFGNKKYADKSAHLCSFIKTFFSLSLMAQKTARSCRAARFLDKSPGGSLPVYRAEAIRMIVNVIRMTVVLLTLLNGMTVVRVKIAFGTTGVRHFLLS